MNLKLATYLIDAPSSPHHGKSCVIVNSWGRGAFVLVECAGERLTLLLVHPWNGTGKRAEEEGKRRAAREADIGKRAVEAVMDAKLVERVSELRKRPADNI